MTLMCFGVRRACVRRERRQERRPNGRGAPPDGVPPFRRQSSRLRRLREGRLIFIPFFFLISLREVSQKQLLRVAKFRRRKLWLCRPDRNLFVSVTMTRTASSGRQLYLRPEVFDIFSSYESLVFSPRDSLRIPWAKNTERQKQNNVKKKIFINIS